MNLAETVELIKALKAAGATHFKSDDFEVTLSAYAPIMHQESSPQPIIPAPQSTVSPQVQTLNEDATKRAQDLIETLKMDDASLLDKIFPAGAGG
jgi:hypothetical protein